MTRKLPGASVFLAVAVCLTAGMLGACDQVGMTHARIDAVYGSSLNMPPHPVEIDPSLLASGAVTVTSSGRGMELYQHIVVKTPIRIVPAEYPVGPPWLHRGPTTQPATQPQPK